MNPVNSFVDDNIEKVKLFFERLCVQCSEEIHTAPASRFELLNSIGEKMATKLYKQCNLNLSKICTQLEQISSTIQELNYSPFEELLSVICSKEESKNSGN